jgi:hypothetical protein
MGGRFLFLPVVRAFLRCGVCVICCDILLIAFSLLSMLYRRHNNATGIFRFTSSFGSNPLWSGDLLGYSEAEGAVNCLMIHAYRITAL